MNVETLTRLEARIALLEAALTGIIDVWFSDAEWVRPEFDSLLYDAHRLVSSHPDPEETQ